jgi:hypothetical protein
MNLGQGDYHVIKVGEVAVMTQQQPGPAAWGAYVTVESCDATVEKARARRTSPASSRSSTTSE